MKAKVAALGVLVLGVMLGSCGGEAESAPGEDSTTAALLSQPVGDGVSTPVSPGFENAPEGPPVPVSNLGYDRGDTAAFVKVVELSDFGCGFCRRFHQESFPILLEEFIDSGMIEWKFLPYVTGMFANSLAATESAECVMEQSLDQYAPYASRLWEQQPDWKGSSEPESVLRGWVDELDLDMARYDSCLSEDRRVSRIAQSTTLARQLGVRGTPSFIVLGYGPLQGALPTEFFQELFTAIHAEETRLRAEAAENGGGSGDPGDSGGG